MLREVVKIAVASAAASIIKSTAIDRHIASQTFTD